MRRDGRYRTRVAAFSGGVCRADAVEEAADRLTDCRNLWWENGGLRTRPGLNAVWSRFVGTAEPYRPEYTDLRLGDDRLVLERRNGTGGSTAFWPWRVSADGSRAQSLGCAVETKGENCWLAVPPQGAQGETALYAFGDDADGLRITAKPMDSDTWVPAKPYIPTVLINGTARGEGTAYEGFNMLTGGFRCLFTTNGKLKQFFLPRKSLLYGEQAAVTVVYTDTEGEEHTFTVTEENGYSAEAVLEGVKVRVRVDHKKGLIRFRTVPAEGGSSENWAPPEAEKANNVSIVAYVSNRVASRRIGGMTCSAWFGGGLGSLKTGTRLFVSGHGEYPGLVHWSDVDNPLYFPENNYAYVGATGEPVTALGKQGDMLVIFKKNSVYAMTYREGSFSAADVMDGTVADVTAAAALFPVRQLHPAIGCDQPGTVALCQNRLVWTNADGRVHTLLSATAYSDSNVRELSGPVSDRIRGALKEASTVCGALWRGWYVLLAGNTAFVLDCSGEAFLRYSAYDDDRKAQRRLSWYIWDLTVPQVTWQYLGGFGETLCLYGVGVDAAGRQRAMHYRLEGTADRVPSVIAETAHSEADFETRPVQARFRTALFEFGRPERYKRMETVWLTASGETGSRLALSYVTERGETPDAGGAVTFSVTEGHRSRRFSPQVGAVCRFGLQGESEGPVCIGEPVITYRMKGGVR